MPSPFPGMDPYFESDLWTSFHTEFAVEIARVLSPSLAPRYAAVPQKRYVVDYADEAEVAIESLYPDVGISDTGQKGAPAASTALAPAPLEIASVMPEPVPHTWLEIRDVENRTLVTTIEFLSPTNKKGDGRQEYLRKRNTIMRSSVHLMEIDFVREGKRIPLKKALPDAPYFVFLSRSDRRPMTQIYPVKFEEPLPEVPVPLLPGDADLPLDLQQVLNAVYDAFNYRLLIDYQVDPPNPLPPTAAKWADDLLRTAKRRK
ncbi:MAG: DUF4058 family protein [Gemmataceae bacterium]|nr:DUF4058 family protein [Gemmataceae bacterium]MCI0741852.1 DUF4058 family protein [Gemmataceae bacterium]